MSEPSPDIRVVSGLAQARELIAQRLRALATPRPVVGITGPVGSGKSTLARSVADAIEGFVLSTDRYLPDYDELPVHLRDEPTYSDVHRLAEDLERLRTEGAGILPIWSFHEHRRTGEEHVRVAGPVVCEGIMALHEQLLPKLDLAVFVEASAQTRWRRWEHIERSGQRGWGVEAAREHFESIAEPTFGRLSQAYRSAASIIVLNDHNDAM